MVYNNAYKKQKTLNDYSWPEISAASLSGKASSLWKVGDSKTITLNGYVSIVVPKGQRYTWDINNDTIDVFIIGFDHNKDLESNGQSSIHFQMGMINNKPVAYNLDGNDILDMTYPNLQCGWNSSSIRTLLFGNPINNNNDVNVTNTFFTALPADLKYVIRPVMKYTKNSSGKEQAGMYVSETKDYIFLPSEYEVFGTTSKSDNKEADYQKQYEYYKSAKDKKKYGRYNVSDPYAWWLRSPAMGYDAFCTVSKSGAVGFSSGTSTCAIAPVFCV